MRQEPFGRAPRGGPAPYDPRAVEIRLAGPRARQACLAIDDGYTSARVWQAVMHSLDEPAAALAPGDAGDMPFSVTFQPLRLPRPVEEAGLYRLRGPQARLAAWAAASCMLVIGPPRPAPAEPRPADAAVGAESGADEAGSSEDLAEPEVWGFVVLNGVPGARLAWIAELVVAAAHRRRGLGRLLLDAAQAWAGAPVAEGGAGGLSVLMVELSPRNYSAIAFCRRQGFHFAGYTDYTLAGGDLRLFFLRPTT